MVEKVRIDVNRHSYWGHSIIGNALRLQRSSRKAFISVQLRVAPPFPKVFRAFLFCSTIYWYMKMIPITCHSCGKITDKPKKEYDRQCRNGRLYFYCSISCSTKDNLTIHSAIKANCLWCNKEFDTTTHELPTR